MSRAILSPDWEYRYYLSREVSSDGIVIAYFGVNPSLADAEVDDQTVRKWKGFTIRNGGCRMIVGNLFAYRSPDVKSLAKVSDPVGPENWSYLYKILSEADILVPCWGNSNKIPAYLRGQIDKVTDVLFSSGKPVKVFGLTSNGQPKHPLMLGYDTTLREWIR
jgi:hypothetical protein